MILLVFVLLGAAAGLLARGSLRNLGHHRLRGLWLCILSFLLQGLFAWLPADALAGSAPLAQPLVAVLRYGLLAAFLIWNIAAGERGLWPWVFGAGTAMNAAVILANSGAMPVAGDLLTRLSPALADSLAAGQVFGYTLATAETRLAFLGDVLYLGTQRAAIGFASPGDILIGLGGGLLVFRLLRARGPRSTKPESA